MGMERNGRFRGKWIEFDSKRNVLGDVFRDYFGSGWIIGNLDLNLFTWDLGKRGLINLDRSFLSRRK